MILGTATTVTAAHNSSFLLSFGSLTTSRLFWSYPTEAPNQSLSECSTVSCGAVNSQITEKNSTNCRNELSFPIREIRKWAFRHPGVRPSQLGCIRGTRPIPLPNKIRKNRKLTRFTYEGRRHYGRIHVWKWLAATRRLGLESYNCRYLNLNKIASMTCPVPSCPLKIKGEQRKLKERLVAAGGVVVDYVKHTIEATGVFIVLVLGALLCNWIAHSTAEPAYMALFKFLHWLLLVFAVLVGGLPMCVSLVQQAIFAKQSIRCTMNYGKTCGWSHPGPPPQAGDSTTAGVGQQG